MIQSGENHQPISKACRTKTAQKPTVRSLSTLAHGFPFFLFSKKMVHDSKIIYVEMLWKI